MAQKQYPLFLVDHSGEITTATSDESMHETQIHQFAIVAVGDNTLVQHDSSAIHHDVES